MRTTKNLTVSLPPAMLRDMEKTARRENRTLSELVRENFRRAQLDEAERRLLADPLLASRLEELKAVLGQLRQESKAKGLDKITEREIDAEVQAVRKQRRKKINAPTK
jgi:2-oxo-4-hydroxy-4-carboxy--5-ureidoimidazoline (OHCU) decarboxylase